MGSSGKVVNLVVGKEVTAINGQFQKTYIGTPTASLSLTLEEGSKLSSIGNDAFKDNTFFVSIDLSNAGQDMTMGQNAFNNLSNLHTFKTGTGKLKLNKESLANLKNCKEFYHNCTEMDISGTIPFSLSFTNPTTAWSGTAATAATSPSFNPTFTWNGWTCNYSQNRYNYPSASSAANVSLSTLSLSVTRTYNPSYQFAGYTHPLMNLGNSVGCKVILGANTKKVADSLFSSGLRYTITSNLSAMPYSVPASVTFPAKTITTTVYATSGPSDRPTTSSYWQVRNDSITIPAQTFNLSLSTTFAAATDTDIISYSSGIKVVSVSSAGNVSEIGQFAFGLDDRTITSTTTVSIAPKFTITGAYGNWNGYYASGSSYFNGSGQGTRLAGSASVPAANIAVPGTTTVVWSNEAPVYKVDTTVTPTSSVQTVNLGTVSTAAAIRSGAFGYNALLNKVVIGSGFNTIETNAFHGVHASSTAYILGKSSNTFKPDSNNGLTSGGNSSLGNIVYLPDAKDLGWYIAHYQIGDAVTAYLFEQIDGTYIINIVGTGATYDTYTASNTPGWHATYGTKVSKVIVDDTVTGVGPYLFYGHTALTSVQFGTGLTSIGAHAFGNCTGLDSFTVPATLTSVGERILEGAAVKTVYYNANTEDAYHSMSGCDANEIILGANVTKIGDGTLGDISGDFFVEAGEALRRKASFTFGKTDPTWKILVLKE